jgi:hypothetical protein
MKLPTATVKVGAGGGFLIPLEFALDVQAMGEAWLDQDFLAEFFPTLHRYADVASLADARRRDQSKPQIIFSEPPQGGGKFYRN